MPGTCCLWACKMREAGCCCTRDCNARGCMDFLTEAGCTILCISPGCTNFCTWPGCAKFCIGCSGLCIGCTMLCIGPGCLMLCSGPGWRAVKPSAPADSAWRAAALLRLTMGACIQQQCAQHCPKATSLCTGQCSQLTPTRLPLQRRQLSLAPTQMKICCCDAKAVHDHLASSL